MKTIHPKPTRGTAAKSIPLETAGGGENLSRPRLLSSDPKGRAGQSYWTIKVSNEPPPKNWGVLHVERAPHDKLCVFQFGTLKSLVKRLKELPDDDLRLVKFARVRLSDGGFQVEIFPTLADARAAEKETAGKHCCPFCMKSDMIDEIWWASERFDGSEFEAPALRCNRCDLVAPKRAWNARGKEVSKEAIS